MEPPLTLQASNLTLAFGGITAVAELSLTVPAGLVTGLVGPNGAGKTTALNLLSGFYAPDAGEIILKTDQERIPISGMPIEERARLGIGRTFQTPRLFKEMPVWENVAAAGAWRGGTARWLEPLWLPGTVQSQRRVRARVLDVLRQLLLHEKAALPPDQLSLGEQRLVEIARAIFAGSRIVLLDEPFAGLSLGEKDRLSAVIDGLRREGVGALLVEHNLEVVRRLASHLIVMDQGRELCRGTPAHVFEDSKVIEVFLGPDALR